MGAIIKFYILMGYRDESFQIVKMEQLISERDEALERVRKLEHDLAEARQWLKNRAPASKRPKAVMWLGMAGLAGMLLGAILWLALGSPLFVPLCVALFVLFAAAVMLGTGNENDGVGHPGPPRVF